MPYYVHMIRIDWYYERASADLRSKLPVFNDEMVSLDHTYHTFLEELRKIAAGQPTLVADALIEDASRAYFLFHVRAGRVDVAQVDERPEDAMADAITLPFGEDIEVTLVRHRGEVAALVAAVDENSIDGDELALPLAYPELAALRQITETTASAIDTGGGSFVAEAGGARYLVELAPGSARIRKLVVAHEPELVARLLREDYAEVPPAPRVAGREYRVALYWPEDMLRFLHDEAARKDRSLSYIAQQAFAHSRYKIAQSERSVLQQVFRSSNTGTAKRKQTLYFPGEMLDAMERQAKRLDASLSFIAQCAVALTSAFRGPRNGTASP